METVSTVNDDVIAKEIDNAERKVVYVAPGLGMPVVRSLRKRIEENKISISMIIDAEEDAHRIGYGDPNAIKELTAIQEELHFPIRKQPGLRIGLLVADDKLLIWSPVARSVEAEREGEQPNAIVLGSDAVKRIENAVGSDNSDVLASDAEIGSEPLKQEEVKKLEKALDDNPPEPFDLARKARIFSSKFRFIQFEVKGIKWSDRKMKISNLLLNADLPPELRDLFNTSIQPFQMTEHFTAELPLFVDGEPVYRRDGEQVLTGITQADLLKEWEAVRDEYLTQLQGFGWLIKRSRVIGFKRKVDDLEDRLCEWVSQLKNYLNHKEQELVDSVTQSITTRLKNSSNPSGELPHGLEKEIQDGLERMLVIDPKIRIVMKDVAWESSRDEEFLDQLKANFSEEQIQGWFEEYTAAKER